MKIRTSPSVIAFQEKAEEVWGLEVWEGIEDPDQDVLFFGLYIENDYEVFRRHSGKKTIFWCGSDILKLMGNYDSRRILKLFPKAEHWCENETEKKNLEECGVKVSGVVPSFLESVYNFPTSFKPTKEPHIFLCGHPGREAEYGWELVERLAEKLPEFTFHLYGVDRPYSPDLVERLNEIDVVHPNIIRHGKVSPGQFNNEIKEYHCGFRPNEHDGFSEVVAKSALLGQYPITKIPYEKIWTYKDENDLLEKFKMIKLQTGPNIRTRSHYLKILNNFPWCPRNYWQTKKTIK